MSTGLNCEIREHELGKWYYVLEDGSASKDAWDWHEYAEAYGPFDSERQANEHLASHHANPGGCSVIPFDANYKPGNVVKQLIARAPENKRQLARR